MTSDVVDQGKSPPRLRTVVYFAIRECYTIRLAETKYGTVEAIFRYCYEYTLTSTTSSRIFYGYSSAIDFGLVNCNYYSSKVATD